MYSLLVYDEAGVQIGVVEHIDSLQWLSLYQDAGEVKLVCNAVAKNIELLQVGNRLYRTDLTERAVIRETAIEDNGKKAVLTVRAVPTLQRWEDRVVMATVSITNIETAMLRIAEDNRRGLPGTASAPKGLPAKTDSQITWGSVLAAERELATLAGYGIREVYDKAADAERFEVYAGVDRTVGDNYVGYFGDDIGNLAEFKIKNSDAKYKNVAIVGGQGEGAARKVITVSLGSAQGDARRELWVDAKDIAATYQIANPTGEVDSSGNPTYNYTEKTYTDAEYTEQLRARGLQKLLAQVETVEITAAAAQTDIKYGRDYSLGDIVPVKVTRYGLRFSARIAGATVISESTGETVDLKLEDLQVIGGAKTL